MFLIFLLMVGVCLVKSTPQDIKIPFDFRRNCPGMHSKNMYVASCNGSSPRITQQDIYIDRRSTTGMSALNLTSFRSVELEASVHVGRISIKDITQATLYLNHSHLKALTVDRVGELTLIHKKSDDTRDIIESLTLNNVNKLSLLSEGEFVWAIDSVKFSGVEDVDLESSHATIYAKNFTMEESNVRLSGKSSLTLKAESARIDKCNLYIHEKGFFDATVGHFLIKDSSIDLKTGSIHLTNSQKVRFLNNSFYEFEKKSLQVFGTESVMFVGNEMFTDDVSGVLSLNRENVKFSQNKFGCQDCSLKKQLLDSDLQDVGDVNYCYVGCNLTLNYFKKLLKNNCFCTHESNVNETTICAVYSIEQDSSQVVTIYDLLRLLLFIIIIVVLTVSLVLCICHKDNRGKIKLVVSTAILPQDLECEQREQQGIVFKNHSYDNAVNIEHVYESVEQHPYVRCS